MNLFRELKNVHEMDIAVKEALDRLPAAVCYFTPDGTIKLCNKAMYICVRMLNGKDLQSYEELKEALDTCGKYSPVKRDGNVYLFPDGCARQYAVRTIRTEDGRFYTETLFSDVTELYRKRRELQQQSEEMKRMYAELKDLSSQLLDVTREQEILNMKNHLHDQMNMGIAGIRQILHANAPAGEAEAAIARFRRAVQILQEENTESEDDLSEFQQDAEVSGIHVNLTGNLPSDAEVRSLLINVMREACVNAARHADAAILNIIAEETDHTVSLHITNDGMPPQKEIVPQGGLKDLQTQIRKHGGTMQIRSLPTFGLTVKVPVHSENTAEEVQK